VVGPQFGEQMGGWAGGGQMRGPSSRVLFGAPDRDSQVLSTTDDDVHVV